MNSQVEKEIYQVSVSPTGHEAGQIEKWLIIEQNNSGQGFYCNWTIIKKQFSQNQVVTISHRRVAIGFVTWRKTSDFTAHIDIAEVKPSYRRKGVGRILIETLLTYLQKQGILIIDLQCAPADSEIVWRRLGFVEFSDSPENYRSHGNGNKMLYRLLAPSLDISSIHSPETIELWNEEPYSTQNKEATYTWDLSFKEGSRELLLPIVHPAHYEWRIRWKSGGNTVRDCKAKYFGAEIAFAGFVIIRELPHNI